MPRILRSQGIYKLFPPIAATPAAPPVETTIHVRCVAVPAARRDPRRQPEPRHVWATQVRSGFVRNFSRQTPLASSDSIQLTPPTTSGFGTLLVLVRRTGTENHAVLSFAAAGPSAVAEFYIKSAAGNQLALWNGSTDSFGTVALTADEGWALIAVTKASGSAVPRFHKCVLSTGVWTHADATTGAIADWTAWASAWLGTSGDGFDFLNGQMAFAAFFGGNALSDASLETFTSISQIARANPTALWPLNQPTVATAVQDVIGAADQVAVTGTTVQSAQIPNFNTDTPIGVSTPMIGIRPPMIIGPGPTEDQTTLRASLTRTRPRHTIGTVLRPPATLEPYSIQLAERTIRARLVKTRPRPTTKALRPPATLEPWSVALEERTTHVWLVPARPRKTIHFLNPPTIIRVPSVIQQQQTIRTEIVRGRRPKTTTRLSPPAVVTAVVTQIFYGPQSHLVRIRPPRTRWTLEPPTTLQVFYGPRSVLTQIRPRPTVEKLRGPTVVRVPSVEQQQQQIRVWLTRGRAGKTDYRLFPPQVVRVPSVEQQEQTIRVELVRTRPRPTVKTLRPPVVVRVPSVEQQQQTIRRWLVKARPRPTTTVLQPPAVIQVNPPVDVTINVTLIRTRPRRTLFLLRPPVFYKAKSDPRRWIVRTRPQPTQTVLGKPTALLTFQTGEKALVRTRPRHTIWTLRPAAVQRFAPLVTTPRVVLTDQRRPQAKAVLRPPAVVRFPPLVTQIRTAVVEARPRPTVRTLRPPTVLRVFDYGRVRLSRIRPRHTIARLFPPTVVEPFREPVSTFIRRWLVRIRPPHTQAKLEPPKGAPHVPGVACLIDVPANVACLIDQIAAEACLRDEQAAQGCLTDGAAASACLVDQSADRAILRDEEA